ncbi:hypothetical protein [Granulicella sp. dw_53]|uniref:hypothetical protein n=1 Tax=Granulicella sp. dw_53 TaxID=2719792 RepID=UPI001BD1C2DD|nr:hypothetical protein [Granulicella sp. dw_53]
MQVRPRDEVFTGIEVALHELSQPLTVLQCRLELGLMDGSGKATHEAVEHALLECRRVNAAVSTMRELVRQGLEQTGRG